MMRKQRFSRFLAAFLSLLILTQSLCLTAFAENEPVTVFIPEGSNAADVNKILTEALLVEGQEAAEWEYYCTVTDRYLTENSAWGSIEGFTSKKNVLFTPHTYIHPALAANNDGEYQVRVAGTSTEYTIHKKAKLDAPITLVEGQAVALNTGDLKSALFNAVVTVDDGLALSAEDVSIQYQTKKIFGQPKWTDVADLKDIGLYTIQVLWAGNDTYGSYEGTVEVEIVSGLLASSIQLRSGVSAELVYDEDSALDCAATKQAIFAAVVESTEPELTADDVTIEYYATPVSGSVGSLGKDWIALKGETKNLLTYPAISAGEQQIRISWNGNEEYEGFSKETTVDMSDRDALQFHLNEAPYEVDLVFDAKQGYDYDATAKAIYQAVVASTSPIEISADDVTVTYDASRISWAPNYKPLNNTDITTKKFGEGTWSIKLSWGGNQQYAGNSVTVDVTMTDSRPASVVVLKEGVSFTYNKDVAVMKQAVLDSVIDWENSTLPARETLSVDDFTFTYNAQLSLLDGANGDMADSIVDKILGDESIQKAYVPFEGKSYDALGQTWGSYPQIGAGEQQIRVAYNGNANYKPSAEADGTVTIDKASVKVTVKSASMYVSAAQDGLNLVSTDPAADFDLYVLYAGITSNVTTGIYLELPARYTSNSTLIKVLDKVLESLGQPTLTQMMQNGITVGQLRELLNAAEVIEALEKLGLDTGSLGQIITVINKLPSIGDNIRIAFGIPNQAGIYTVAAITDNSNYKTGVGMGALVLKADKAELVWNQDIGGKLTAAEAQNTDFGASLKINGVAVEDQSSVHVLYSGLTSKWKVYSSTTTPPTEPGRYTMTVVILGGNYLASPITRSFQITK